MARTRNRPLPSGRMEPGVALWFGLSLAAVSLPALALGANLLTAFLGLVAFLSYVLVYTPLKSRTSAAMLVGAVPGALPPLMGWTAVTGQVDAGGFVLFSILFLWQIPHFLAIALFRKEEYAAAGLKSVPLERGDESSRAQLVLYLVALVPMTLLPYQLHIAGAWYLTVAARARAGVPGDGRGGFLPPAREALGAADVLLFAALPHGPLRRADARQRRALLGARRGSRCRRLSDPACLTIRRVLP